MVHCLTHSHCTVLREQQWKPGQSVFQCGVWNFKLSYHKRILRTLILDLGISLGPGYLWLEGPWAPHRAAIFPTGRSRSSSRDTLALWKPPLTEPTQADIEQSVCLCVCIFAKIRYPQQSSEISLVLNSMRLNFDMVMWGYFMEITHVQMWSACQKTNERFCHCCTQPFHAFLLFLIFMLS